MAKKKCNVPIGQDMNGVALATCDRVEISPHFDLWMRGARYGVVRGVRNGVILVKMDHPQVRKLFRVRNPADLKRVR